MIKNQKSTHRSHTKSIQIHSNRTVCMSILKIQIVRFKNNKISHHTLCLTYELKEAKWRRTKKPETVWQNPILHCICDKMKQDILACTNFPLRFKYENIFRYGRELHESSERTTKRKTLKTSWASQHYAHLSLKSK